MEPEKACDIEIHLLLEALRLRFGYDFQSYAKASLKRRILHAIASGGYQHVAEAIPHLLHDTAFRHDFIYELSVPATEMFRDPTVFRALLEQVVPVLKSYPLINIWHAGCATGEEVYSFAILLQEAGLQRNVRIYATDLNDKALHTAQEGVYPAEKMKQCMEGYRKAGGRHSFSDYCHVKYGLAKLDDALKENVTFANHNLATDAVFVEAHLILCRNVFIYFNQALQNRALWLFHDSLVREGFLCLGRKESLRFFEGADRFTTITEKEKIFQKRRQERRNR